jgi:DNA ligase-1
MSTLFKSLAELLEKVEATKKRLEIIDVVADFLKRLGSDEVEPSISIILGRAFPKKSQITLKISWLTLSEVLQHLAGADWTVFREAFAITGDIGSAVKAVFQKTNVKKQNVLLEKTLSINEVRRLLQAIASIAGSGSGKKKERLVTALLSQVSPVEAKYLVRVFLGEMRTGLHEALIEQAVAKAFETPLATVQKASMVTGDIGVVASIAKTKGKKGLSKIGFQVFRPVKLMLAQTAKTVGDALAEHGGRTAFEYKYDGARIQVHKRGDKVRIFSRRLTDATKSLPEVVEDMKSSVKADEAIMEGEVIAVNQNGRPIPFQHLMRRFKRVRDVRVMSEEIPVRLYLFDVLFLDGASLLAT